MICSANQLTGFYMRTTLALNELKAKSNLQILIKHLILSQEKAMEADRQLKEEIMKSLRGHILVLLSNSGEVRRI